MKSIPYRTSPTENYHHDYKDLPPLPDTSDSSNIKEISVNPLYSDSASATKTSFEPPLPATPVPPISHPSNGVAAYPNGGGGITLPSDPPPLYAEIPANKKPEKVVVNPQYGAVGGEVASANGTNGTADNPRYTPMVMDSKDNGNMYASVNESGEALGHPQQEKQYAQPYAHIPAHTGSTSNVLEPDQSTL